MTAVVSKEVIASRSKVKGLSYNDLMKLSDSDLIEIVQKVDTSIKSGGRVARRDLLTRDSAQTILLNRYAPLVARTIAKWRPFTDKYEVDGDDIAQSVHEAILAAIKDFDTSKDRSLFSYAKFFIKNKLSKTRRDAGCTLARYQANYPDQTRKARCLKEMGYSCSEIIDHLMRDFGVSLFTAYEISNRMFDMRVWNLEFEDESEYQGNFTQNIIEDSLFHRTPEEHNSSSTMSEVVGAATDRVLSRVKPVVREEFLKRLNATCAKERAPFKSLPKVFAEHGITNHSGEPLSSERIRQTFKEIEASILVELKESYGINELSDIL